MAVILRTAEENERALAHGLVLCSPEDAEEYLMHYRVGGEVNGRRRWQDEKGRLTEAGYQHYAEMYGWNKKVKKAGKLQAKADKAEKKAEKYQYRSDVTALRARRKTARGKDTEHLDEVAAARASRAQEARIKARIAQRDAVKYADKLQRKEDRMAKYLDENGDLNEKGMEKYAYDSPTKPGEKKMSLMGRIKFGNEYSNKFNKEHASKMTKEEYKESGKDFDGDKETKNTEPAKKEHSSIELSDMARTEFNGNKEHDDDLRDVPKDVIKDRIRLTRDWYHDEEYVTTEEREGELKNLAKNIKDLHGEGLKKYGDDLLSYIYEKREEIVNKLEKRSGKSDPDEYATYDELSTFVTDRIYDKSGSMNADAFKPGSNADKVYNSESYKKVREDMLNRYDEIHKKTGYSISNNYKKLMDACKKDDVWQKLDKEYQKHESDLLGAILKDIGFRDTPENRYIIYRFAFLD